MVLKYKVIITSRAKLDLDEIYEYIFNESGGSFFARKVIKNIKGKILSLDSFPERSSSNKVTDFYVVHYKKYKIFYKIDKQNCIITVANVAHSARRSF